jgi:hypothetical protein
MKIGDKAIVTKNTSDHRFPIGTVVTITEINGTSYTADDGDDYWYLKRKELRKIKDFDVELELLIALNKLDSIEKVYSHGDLLTVVTEGLAIHGHQFKKGDTVKVISAGGRYLFDAENVSTGETQLLEPCDVEPFRARRKYEPEVELLIALNEIDLYESWR